MRLEEKVAIVTGGARGMGRAHCLTLAREGANIVACDINQTSSLVGYGLARNEDLDETVNQVRALGRKAVGVIGLTRTLAAELAPSEINVNAICPAAVNTPMLSGAFEQAGTTLEEALKTQGSLGVPSIVPGELIPPEYISSVVLFLASDDARFLHGRSILVGSSTALIP